MHIVSIGCYGFMVLEHSHGLEIALRRIHPKQIEIFRIEVETKAKLWEVFYLIWCSAIDDERAQAVIFDVDNTTWTMSVDLKGLYNMFAGKLAE